MNLLSILRTTDFFASINLCEPNQLHYSTCVHPIHGLIRTYQWQWQKQIKKCWWAITFLHHRTLCCVWWKIKVLSSREPKLHKEEQNFSRFLLNLSLKSESTSKTYLKTQWSIYWGIWTFPVYTYEPEELHLRKSTSFLLKRNLTYGSYFNIFPPETEYQLMDMTYIPIPCGILSDIVDCVKNFKIYFEN